MHPLERRFIEAAEELYSAAVEAREMNWITNRLVDTITEFALASNMWADHPAKLEAPSK